MDTAVAAAVAAAAADSSTVSQQDWNPARTGGIIKLQVTREDVSLACADRAQGPNTVVSAQLQAAETDRALIT